MSELQISSASSQKFGPIRSACQPQEKLGIELSEFPFCIVLAAIVRVAEFTRAGNTMTEERARRVSSQICKFVRYIVPIKFRLA